MSLVRSLQDTVIPLGKTINAGVPIEKYAGFIKNRHNIEIDGGILRWKAGAPEGRGGQIFAFVKDVCKSSDAAKQVQHIGPQMGGVSQLSELAVGLSGIGAVASVANLAVSAVGFYVLNKKVNALQEEMNQLHEAVSEGFAQMEQRFVQVQYLLGDLAQGQKAILDGQRHIQDQNEAASFAPVQTVLQRLQECRQSGQLPGRDRSGRWLDDARSARNTFAYLIDTWCTGQVSPDTLGFARAVGYYQLWATALIAEARLLRMLGRTKEASDMIYSALSEWYFPRASKTANLLIDFKPGILLSGAFDGRVSTMQYFNLQELRQGARATLTDREKWVAEADRGQQEVLGSSSGARLKSMEAMNARTTYSRAAQAYSLLETGRRVNTMANEYEMCARQDLSMEEWENVHARSEDPNLKLIPAS